ncbi:MAG: hypothetical protein ABIZ49_10935 [Opitutaceae bacterium]
MSTEAMQTFVRKHPISVGCGVLSLLLAGAIYFRSDKIGLAETELAEKSAEGEKYLANIKNSGQLKEQIDTLVAANKDIDARIIRANQLGANSQIFYKLESETGVKLIDFRQSPTPAKGSGAFIPVGFTVAIQGELSQLLTVLRTLESGAHYCRVLNASCTLNGNNRQLPLILSLNLELLGVQ